ncbi:MAG: tetratricopeptide repeat protein [Planctomycetota bacterium]|jgi:hypothetical protein
MLSNRYCRWKRNEQLVKALCALAVVWSCAVCRAEEGAGSGQLFSSSVGEEFYEIAHEMAQPEKLSGPEIEQAITFLTATIQLDSRAKYVLPEMIKLAARHRERDYSELMRQLLVSYVGRSANLEVAREALSYVLARLDSREEREKFLEETLQKLGDKNTVLASELATLLGLLKAEKADNKAAQFYFLQAYSNNRYNKVAFAKLTELGGEQIPPAVYVERLRLAVGENPLDIEAGLAFARYAERLQLYETAADAYEYCAKLFGFLYPSESLPASIYLPWAISNYNTQREQYKCLQIASELRDTGRFDLFMEAIAGKAAAKLGEQEQAKVILKAAGDKARQSLLMAETQRAIRGEESGDRHLEAVSPQQLAWFYCFALPDVNEAIEWANRAYSSEPDSATAAAILAYSLVMNGQTDWAKLLVDSYERSQIAEITLAQIHLARQQKNAAIESLKSAITRDPGSLAAERAKEILAEQGGEYVPAADPEAVLAALRSRFSELLVPAFVRPEEMISFELKLRGGKFSYGSRFNGAVALTNNYTEPLVISDDGLLQGNIRVDARVSGDLNREIPNVVSMKIRPSLPVEPGRSMFIPLRLVTGELRQLLLRYPQASLEIQFTAFMDPVITEEGELINRVADIEPARVVIKRPGIELSSRYLQNRLDSLSEGRQGQKIKTAKLFSGLLMERHAMAGREPLYRLAYAGWVPDILKSALVRNLSDDDWVVRVHAMAGMLSLPLDYELTSAVSKNLNDSYWPARLMAVYLLAKSQDTGFAKVLEWTARHDSNEFVRQMAAALGGGEGERRAPAGATGLQ